MLTAILQSFAVIVLAVLGGLAGWWFSQRRSPAWLLGFVLPLVLLLMIGATRRWYPLGLVPPFRWLVAGRKEFMLVAPLSAMVMMTPIFRLPRARTRVLASLFVPLFVIQSSILPVMLPTLQRGELANLKTRIGSDGVCRQSTDYTCGPAAAVTALRVAGISATESEIALLAQTSRATGTQPDVLADALQARYASQGVTFTYRAFKNAADLPKDRPTIALINYKMFVDHYVTVLHVGKNQLTIGDPLVGITTESFEDFERDWRMVGIVVGGSVATSETRTGSLASQ